LESVREKTGVRFIIEVRITMELFLVEPR
jgi:hypothetical protein